MNIDKYLLNINFYEDYLTKIYHYKNVCVNTVKGGEKYCFIDYEFDGGIVMDHEIRIKNLEKYILSLRREKIERIKSLIK